MKKSLFVSTCVLTTLFFTSCGSGTVSEPQNPTSASTVSSPTQVAESSSLATQPEASSSSFPSDGLLTVSASDSQESVRLKFAVARFDHEILGYSDTHVAGLVSADKTVRVADLSSGQDVLSVQAEDLKLPDSVKFDSFQRATLLNGSIIIESLVLQGEDAYNEGEEKTAYSIFDIKQQKLLGEVILGPSTNVYSTDQSLLNRKPAFSVNWEAGVPGENLALVSDRQDDFSYGSTTGNVIVFQDGQAPNISTHDSEQLKNAYFVHNGELVQIENSRVMNAYFQISEDEVIRESSSSFDPHQLLKLDGTGAIVSTRDLPYGQITRAEAWASSSFCTGEGNQNLVLDIATLETRDLGDVSCESVSSDGTVLGKKGDKRVPVLLSSEGSLLDIPSNLNSVQLVNDSLLFDGSGFYEYSFK